MNSESKKKMRDDTGLLPEAVIFAAIQGDIEAMEIVLQHYESYINYLSRQKFIDEWGNVYYAINRDIRDRLRSKLIRTILRFKI